MSYIVGLTSGPMKTVEQYLYGGNQVIATMTTGFGNVFLIDCTETVSTGFNANAQSDRMATGLIGARVYDDYVEASKMFAEECEFQAVKAIG